MSQYQAAPANPVPPLPYAAYQEPPLLRAYQYVGWFFLLTALVSLLSIVGMAVSGSRLGMAASSLLYSQLLTAGPQVLMCVGAIGMIRGQAWGAWALIAVAALRLLLIAAMAALIVGFGWRGSPQTVGAYVALNSYVVTAMSAAVSAFLPLMLLRLCSRQRVLV